MKEISTSWTANYSRSFTTDFYIALQPAGVGKDILQSGGTTNSDVIYTT